MSSTAPDRQADDTKPEPYYDSGSVGQRLRFRRAYGQHRATEGRGLSEAELLTLPYLNVGPLARQWAVRARSFDRFVERVLRPAERQAAGRPLAVLDVGAGNGWFCFRMSLRGQRAVAVDIRDDAVDGLGAGAGYGRALDRMFGRVQASFDEIPLAARAFDVVVFNASIHYAVDLQRVIAEAARVVAPGGRIAILDTPFYRTREAGDAMVAEKRANGAARFGELAADLLALPFIEYLTADRLTQSSPRELRWQRHRVRYPLWYELRPALNALTRKRPPSRFDVWETIVP
jgi:SAM-dependent methyltransferase